MLAHPSGRYAWWAAGVAIVAAFFWLGRDRRAVTSYVVGLVLDVPALVIAWLVRVFPGCGSAGGEIDPWMWTVGVAVIMGGSIWSLRRPTRTFWGMPVAVLAGFVVIVVLAVTVNGSTGSCPD